MSRKIFLAVICVASIAILATGCMTTTQKGTAVGSGVGAALGTGVGALTGNKGLELARHAEDVGADFVVVHAPALHFTTAQDETLMGYYRSISEQVDIGIALWSHPDSGYLMSPELCNRLADLDNVVAIKYSVPRPMYSELTSLASDRIQVSTASEDEWLDNIIDLDWRLYLCSSPPFLLQTANDRRMHEYTQAAFEGGSTTLGASAPASTRSGPP